MARANWKSPVMLARQGGAIILAGLRRCAVQDVLRRHRVAGLSGLASGGRNSRRTVAGGRVQRVIGGEVLLIVEQGPVVDIVVARVHRGPRRAGARHIRRQLPCLIARGAGGPEVDRIQVSAAVVAEQAVDVGHPHEGVERARRHLVHDVLGGAHGDHRAHQEVGGAVIIGIGGGGGDQLRGHLVVRLARWSGSP